MEKLQISLAAARVNAGMTQEDVAKSMQITKQTLINWEKGRTWPKPAQFSYLCELYSIPKSLIFMPYA